MNKSDELNELEGKADTSSGNKTQSNDYAETMEQKTQDIAASVGSLISKRRQVWEITLNVIRRSWWMILAIAMIVWASADPGVLNLFLLAISFIGRLLFAILFIGISFLILFKNFRF